MSESVRKSSELMMDKNGKPLQLQDYEAKVGVGVTIGVLGHKLWVCVDGVAVLRIKAPEIMLEDMRESESDVLEALEGLIERDKAIGRTEGGAYERAVAVVKSARGE